MLSVFAVAAVMTVAAQETDTTFAVAANEIRVDCFVRKVQKEGLIVFLTRIEPVDGVVRQLISDVTLLRHTALTVDIESVIACLWHNATRAVTVLVISALAAKRNPMVEASLRDIVITHVPFADKGRLVAGLLQGLGEKMERRINRVVVVDDAVIVRVQAGKNRRPTGRTKRRRHESVGKVHSASSQPVQVWCLQEWMPHHAERVPTMIVAEDE